MLDTSYSSAYDIQADTNRTEFFLALMTFLLTSIVYVLGDGNTTPQIIVVPVLIVVHGIPIYLLRELKIYIGDNTAWQ